MNRIIPDEGSTHREDREEGEIPSLISENFISSANLRFLLDAGFKLEKDGEIVHPDHTVRIVHAEESDLPPGAAAQFTFKLTHPGYTRILRSSWVENRDVEAILRNMDAILREDFRPIISVSLMKPADHFYRAVVHEAVHAGDALTEDGKRQYALQFAQRMTDPCYLPEALAYSCFTELRAYAAEGYSKAVGVTRRLQDYLDTYKPDIDDDLLVQNARGLIPQLTPLCQVTLERTTQELLSDPQTVTSAGAHLARLMVKYGVERLDPLSNILKGLLRSS